MITHDLGIVAEICDEVAVMYAGRIVEYGNAGGRIQSHEHPYTEGLFNSIPNLNDRKAMLTPIQGFTPDPTDLPSGCAFCAALPLCTEACKEQNSRTSASSDDALCTLLAV